MSEKRTKSIVFLAPSRLEVCRRVNDRIRLEKKINGNRKEQKKKKNAVVCTFLVFDFLTAAMTALDPPIFSTQ